MGNRHRNKKLQRAVRARAAETGETYQQALSALQRLEAPASAPGRAPDKAVDLLGIRYFGVAAALATFEIAGRLSVLVVSTPHRPAPFPTNPMFALGLERTVH